jgi:L-fuconolactonase
MTQGDPRIIDGHVHAWRRWPYESDVPDSATRGSAQQLLFELDANGVGAALVVAASLERNRQNNDYVARMAASYPGRLYHFADVDCRWSDTYHVPGSAERVAIAAERFQPSGITHYMEPHNDGWLRSDEGRAFFHAAAERGLPVSLSVSPGWYDDLRLLAFDVPEVRIMCHHLCGVTSWPDGIPDALDRAACLKECENLYLKLSGFYYGSARPWDYPYNSVLESALPRFIDDWGVRRLIWGSDFPAFAENLTYRQSLEVVRTHCAPLFGEEMDAVLGGNLREFLR